MSSSSSRQWPVGSSIWCVRSSYATSDIFQVSHMICLQSFFIYLVVFPGFEEELYSFISPCFFFLQNAIFIHSAKIYWAPAVSMAATISQKSWLKHIKEDEQDLWQGKGISTWLIPLPPVGLLSEACHNHAADCCVATPHYPRAPHLLTLLCLYFIAIITFSHSR